MDDNKNSKSNEFEELLYSQNEGFIMFVKSVLDSAGIEYIARDETYFYVPQVVPTRIFVKKGDFKKARHLLKEYL